MNAVEVNICSQIVQAVAVALLSFVSLKLNFRMKRAGKPGSKHNTYDPSATRAAQSEFHIIHFMKINTYTENKPVLCVTP